MSATPGIVHAARGAGRWFPAAPDELRRVVTRYIEEAQPPPVTGTIVAALAPHAGYVYSGAVAGHTFRALRDQAAADAPDTVVILGFSHRAAFSHVAVLDGAAVATPLGETPLDADALRTLTAGSPVIRADSRPHDGEHSAENEIPFAQVACPGARLVVALTGTHDRATLHALAAALHELSRRRKIVVVASTDMLHDPDYAKVRSTDLATLRRLEQLDDEGLARDWSYDRQTVCGFGPVQVALAYARARGCRQGTVLTYRNSGDDRPESRGQWVVGYGAVVFGV
jgi:AmmeMemoRadiSam system protein B